MPQFVLALMSVNSHLNIHSGKVATMILQPISLSNRMSLIVFVIALLPTFSFGNSIQNSLTAQEISRNDLRKQQPQGVKTLFKQTGRIASDKVIESSGLALGSGIKLGISQAETELVWTVNDSGCGAELFAISISGKTIAEVQLLGSINQDWEAMGSIDRGGAPYLIVADVGDNGLKRDDYQIYILPEPELNSVQLATAQLPLSISVTPRRVDFTYEDGAHNCEAIAVDPITNEIWLVEKVYLEVRRKTAPGIYAFKMPEFEKDRAAQIKGSANQSEKQSERAHADESVVAKRIGEFPVRNVTGMSFSKDGRRLIVRNYFNAHLYQRQGDKSWRETVESSKPIAIPLPLQRQGESICFSSDANSVILTSELKHQPIWRVDLELYLQQQKQQRSKTDGAK